MQVLTHTPLLRDYFLSDRHLCLATQVLILIARQEKKSLILTCRRISALCARLQSSSRSFTLDTRHHFLLIRFQVLLKNIWWKETRSFLIFTSYLLKTDGNNFQLLYMIWTHAHHLAGYEQQVHQRYTYKIYCDSIR